MVGLFSAGFSVSMINFPPLKIFGPRGFVFLLLIHFTSTLTNPKHSHVSSTATKRNHLKSPQAIPTVTNKENVPNEIKNVCSCEDETWSSLHYAHAKCHKDYNIIIIL